MFDPNLHQSVSMVATDDKAKRSYSSGSATKGIHAKREVIRPANGSGLRSGLIC